MRIGVIGGGPGGLYTALLAKKAMPAAEVAVVERNRPDDTFGWGVVFSDETLSNFLEADEATYRAITSEFVHWDAIDIHFGGTVVRSGGHGFSGVARRRLLQMLQARCRELGVVLEFEREVDGLAHFAGWDLVVAADGINSRTRDALSDHFCPDIRRGRSRFTWLGTTKVFDAFKFFVHTSELGVFTVHAYPFDRETSTFIVETDDLSFRRAGLDRMSVAESVAFCERLFAAELEGHPLLTNKSEWIEFRTVRNATWHHDNVVLIGDAAHTAHFSIGSGTKLAMEDAIALVDALSRTLEVPEALRAYQEARWVDVAKLQKTAQTSREWFENITRYRNDPPLQFALSLMTRSKRVTHDNLRIRDAAFVAAIDRDFADRAGMRGLEVAPPMFTPLRLRGIELHNRVVVSSMCQYSAEDGTPDDWHLVHLGSRALGGAALVMSEMTDVSALARISPGCTGMYSDGHAEAWKRVVDFVHTHSRAKIGMQLGHAGRKGSTKRMWEGDSQPLDRDNWPVIAPSALPYYPHSQVPREMDRADMAEVCAQFVRAAERAGEAGFDLLELHMAHGYLLASFLSPLTNRRSDAYGGDTAGRMRWPLEVFEAVRAVWPAERPMSVRISATDWADGGIADEDVLALARALAERGCDLIDVSTGQTVCDQQPVYGRMYQTPWSDLVRHEVGIATMTVGAIQNWDQINTIVASGRADLCALARPHLYDPYFTLHAAAEQGWEIPWPDQYRSAKPATKRP